MLNITDTRNLALKVAMIDQLAVEAEREASRLPIYPDMKALSESPLVARFRDDLAEVLA